MIGEGELDREQWFRMFNSLPHFKDLTILRLRGGLVICPTFFQGVVVRPETPFPSLVELEIEFAGESADGQWFFEDDGHAIENSRNNRSHERFWDRVERQHMEDECEWYDGGREPDKRMVEIYGDAPLRVDVECQDYWRLRSSPDKRIFLPFLIDASKVVSRIPSLRKFFL